MRKLLMAIATIATMGMIGAATASAATAPEHHAADDVGHGEAGRDADG